MAILTMEIHQIVIREKRAVMIIEKLSMPIYNPLCPPLLRANQAFEKSLSKKEKPVIASVYAICR